MPTIPRLLLRTQNRVDLTMQSDPTLREYRVSAAGTLDDAFTGSGAVMFSVRRDGSFRSPTIVEMGWGLTEENRRRVTSAVYDPADYAASTGAPDGRMSYVTVEERNLDGTYRPAGPILIIPPSPFLSNYRPHLTVRGTAPNVANTADRLPPSGAMHVALPRHADSVIVRNDGPGTLSLSFSAGLPEIDIAASTEHLLPDAVVSEFLVHSDGSTAAFTMTFAVVNGSLA